MSNFQKVAQADQIPPGKGKKVLVAGKAIAVFNVGGTLHAVDDTCLHRGGSLGEGTLDGTMVSCPIHAWQYDVTRGSTPNRGTVKLNRYAVKVEGADVLLDATPLA
jgi:nitrite reductase (NADH) small subunit